MAAAADDEQTATQMNQLTYNRIKRHAVAQIASEISKNNSNASPDCALRSVGEVK